MAPNSSEAASILPNQISLRQASIQRLVKSWLPPQTAEDIQTERSEELLDEEEKGLFTPMPEVAGVGFKLPSSGEVKREELSCNDKLRKRLLGNNYEIYQNSMVKISGKSSGTTSSLKDRKPRSTPQKRPVDDDSDDDDGGRSSLGRSKQKKQKDDEMRDDDDDVAGDVDPSAIETSTREHVIVPKKATNYLDEVLAKKSRKKKRKRNDEQAGPSIERW